MTGECVLSRMDGRIRVERADPEVYISFELIDEIVHLAGRGRLIPGLQFDGCRLRIEAENQTVVYELIMRDFGRRAWLARWPD